MARGNGLDVVIRTTGAAWVIPGAIRAGANALLDVAVGTASRRLETMMSSRRSRRNMMALRDPDRQG